jgi:arabinofuranosyltransferase
MSAAPSSPPQRAGLVLLGAALATYLLESSKIPAQYDDAYISYRYAANLLAGNGLVFNPGEYVEGISNLLWTLLVAVGMAVGIPAKVVGHVLGLASGAGVLVATYLYVRALLPERSAWAGLAAWIVYSTPSFERWAISGMETPMFSAFIAGAFAAEARSRAGLATLLAALAMLTRPEGALVAASLFGFRALALGLRDARVWGHALAYAGLCVALTAFRLAYYGVPLPNTFYAKVGGVWLNISLLSTTVFLAGSGGLFLFPAIVWAWNRRIAWPGGAFVLVFLLYVVYVGGTQRYLTPVVPCIAALGSAGAAAWWQRGAFDRATAAGYIAFTLMFNFFGFGLLRIQELDQAFGEDSRWHGIAAERKEDANGEHLAALRTQLLRQRGEPIASVATGGIGALGFFSGLPIVDILGVIDPVVARTPVPPSEKYSLPGHQRSNADYVFSREPDYILIGNGEDLKRPDWVPAVNDLRAHPEMARRYVWDREIIGYKRVK